MCCTSVGANTPSPWGEEASGCAPRSSMGKGIKSTDTRRAQLLDDDDDDDFGSGVSEGAGAAGPSCGASAASSSDAIGTVQGQLNDVKSVMQDNVNQMLNNLEKVRVMTL